MNEWKDEIRRRLEELRLDPAREAAIVEELTQHLEESYESLCAEGATAEEARRAALAGLSSPLSDLRNTQRAAQDPLAPGDAASGSLARDLWRDLRYAGRTLRKAPGFAAFIILTLALGIGANTTVFTVLNTILLNPLPVRDT